MCKPQAILHLIFLHVITRIDKLFLDVITLYQKKNFLEFFLSIPRNYVILLETTCTIFWLFQDVVTC